MPSLAEKLAKRKEALEAGDATGGDAFGERRNADAVREELGSSRDLAKSSKRRKHRKHK